MIDAQVLARSFTYNGVKLPDPDPRMTPEEVKTVFSHQYPELATAAITGPEAAEDPAPIQLCEGYWDKGVNSSAVEEMRLSCIDNVRTTMYI